MRPQYTFKQGDGLIILIYFNKAPTVYIQAGRRLIIWVLGSVFVSNINHIIFSPSAFGAGSKRSQPTHVSNLV